MEPLPTISVIIPVYNVERYVGRCINSVIAQTYPKIECIIVDDCGNDASMDIVRKRIADYRGNIAFRILRHERNRGLSAARNTGTDAASGEYVYFLDSDDLLTHDGIALLAAPLRERRADFVLGNYASGGDKTCFLPIKIPSGFIFGNEKIRAGYLRGEWFMMAWNKLTSREFLLRERIRFGEGLLHEDNLWSFQIACCASSMCVVNALTYVYTIRGNSITTAKSRRNFDSLIRIADECENFAREHALATDAALLRFLTVQREQLTPSALAYGLGEAWKTYRTAVRPQPFSAKKFRALNAAGKVRYLHHLLPAPLGFFYSLAVGKAISGAMIFKQMLSR